MSLEINKSLYDEALQYSDQYMPLAMMPAIVDEIKGVSDKTEELLPTIDEGDAGKVLTVNAGETGAEWATPSGGGGTTPLIVTLDSDTGYTDKTYKECKDAILAGQMVLYRYYYEYEGQVQQDSYFALTSLDEQSGLYSVFFGNSYTFATDDPTHTMYIPD